MVAQFKDRPVKFFSIGASDTLASAKAFSTETKMVMPVFADAYGVMERRYGFKISLRNISQARIVGPDGKIVFQHVDVTAADLEKVLADTKVAFRYKGKGWDKALDKAVDAFDWNRWAEGAKLLQPLRRSSTKVVKESAEKLYEELKAQGERWKAEAEACVETDPVKAYDLYSLTAAVFAGEELGKAVAAPLAALRKNKVVIAELAARKYYDEIPAVMAKLPLDRKPAVVQMFETVVKRHPGTPTAEKSAAFAKELSEAAGP